MEPQGSQNTRSGTFVTQSDRLHPPVRPLLIAEAANPKWVSVPLEGWSHSAAILRMTEGHLVTHVRNREAILAEGLVEGRDFTAIDSDALARPAYKLAGLLRGGAGKGWTAITAAAAMTYPYFEHLLWKHFRKDLKAGTFDLVHRITPLSPTVPSLLAKKCARIGLPFVIGPLNGGVPWPADYGGIRRQEREWLSYVRGAYKLLPGYGATRKHASAILAGSRDTLLQLGNEHAQKSFYVPENAIDPARFTDSRSHRANLPLKAIFVGRLVPYKGADMLIEAAAPLIRNGQMTLEIIGDGPMYSSLKGMVSNLSLDGKVLLPGWVEHRKLQNHLVRSDLFVFPSIREFGGAVVLEAMASGLVPIVVAYGGPGELVSEETGFRIPIGPREAIISSLREVLSRIAAHPEAIDQMSTAARNRVMEAYTWEAKARNVVSIYNWVLGRSKERPLPLSRWRQSM